MAVTTAVEWFDSNLPLPAESNVITPGFQAPHNVFHILFLALGWTKPKSLSRKVSSLFSHICSYNGYRSDVQNSCKYGWIVNWLSLKEKSTWMGKYWHLKNSHLNNTFQIKNKTDIKCPVIVVCFAQTAFKKAFISVKSSQCACVVSGHVHRADSPYTQNTQACVGPRKTRGPPCSQRCFNFSFVFEYGQRSWKYEWSFILMRCPVTLSTEKSAKSCNVNIEESLALTKNVNETCWKNAEPQKRYCFSSISVCAIRDEVKHGHIHFIHSFIPAPPFCFGSLEV